MLRKAIYPKVEPLLNDIAKKLQAKGFTPNQLTLAGMGVNFLAGWAFASGNFILAGIILLIAALGDLLDGPLARVSGKASKFGAFLDSTVDRYSDVFLLGGLAIYYGLNHHPGKLFLVLGAIAGSFVTSYTKARSENFIPSCSVGFLERAERVIIIALAGLLPFLMPLALLVLFVGSNYTAIERVVFTQKQLEKTAE